MNAEVLLFFVDREEEDQTSSFFEVLAAEAKQPFKDFFPLGGLDLSLVVFLPLTYSLLVHPIHQVLLVLLQLLGLFLLPLFLVLFEELAFLPLLIFLLLVHLLFFQLFFSELFVLFNFLLSMWLCLRLFCWLSFFFLFGDCPAHRSDAVRRVGDDRIEEFSLSEGEPGAIDSDDVGNAEFILLKI